LLIPLKDSAGHGLWPFRLHSGHGQTIRFRAGGGPPIQFCSRSAPEL